MPGRNHIFEEGGYYHIYNKSIDEKKPFMSARNCQIFEHMMWFYRARKISVKHSRFLELPPASQSVYLPLINNPEESDVELVAYCLMPNHYHMVVQEKSGGGISRYLSKVQNSFTRYYNIKLQRKGQVFVGAFKSKPIATEEMLRHVLRYVHLNPFSSGVVDSIEKLLEYPHSSLKELNSRVELRPTLCTNVEKLLDYFGGDKCRYMRFLLDNADYQKSLEIIKKIDKSPIR